MLPSYSLPYVQVTCCGLTAQAVQTAVTSITVINQGPRLSYWPPAVCQFSNITSINLSGNAITFIPQSIQELQGLQQLLISRNDLGSLPPEIGALTALTELDVGANKISKLPDALCKLTGLEVCIALAFNFACRCGVGWPTQGGVRVGDAVKAVLGSQGPAPAPAIHRWLCFGTPQLLFGLWLSTAVLVFACSPGINSPISPQVTVDLKSCH